MSTLAGQAIKDKYGNLLHVEGGMTSTLKSVEGGDGTASALSLSTTEVEIDGTLSFASSPSESLSDLTGLFLDSNNNVVKRTLDASAFSSAAGAGVFEEAFIGKNTSAHSLPNPGDSKIVIFSDPTNIVDSTSFHFGNAPAQLRLDPTSGEYIENITAAQFPVFIDMSAVTEVTSNNSNIAYTLQKWDGGSWNNIASFTRVKSSIGSFVDSFWGIYMLGPSERFRIQVSSTTGNIGLSAQSQFKFIVKETGNIL
jgi:hypothetical protein